MIIWRGCRDLGRRCRRRQCLPRRPRQREFRPQDRALLQRARCHRAAPDHHDGPLAAHPRRPAGGRSSRNRSVQRPTAPPATTTPRAADSPAPRSRFPIDAPSIPAAVHYRRRRIRCPVSPISPASCGDPRRRYTCCSRRRRRFRRSPAPKPIVTRCWRRLTEAAKADDAGFTAFSADRGKAFFLASQTGGKPDTPSCTSCHTDNPKKAGQTRAGKEIAPMAVSVTADRYTDPEKVAKWFQRNCNERSRPRMHRHREGRLPHLHDRRMTC